MSKRKHTPDGQLSLWPEDQQQEAQTLDLDALLFYTRENLKFHDPHDDARREWLRKWAEEQGYKELWYTTHGKYDGYIQHGVPASQERWIGFLQNAAQFNVYCCFVTVFAPHPLSYYLEDAVARGEMKASSLHDDLVWKPGNHNVTRDAKWLRGGK